MGIVTKNLVKLPARMSDTVLISAALVSGHRPVLADHLRRALDSSLSLVEVYELIFQSLLFDGYPCALEGLIVLNEMLGERPRKGAPREAYSPENIELWRERGLALCSQIYGGKFKSLLRNVKALSPSLKEWMLVEGYGRILGRPGLDIQLRELGIVAMLTVKRRPRQLESHIRGAMRLGISRIQLLSAMDLCKPLGMLKDVNRAMIICRKLTRKSTS
jgi:4-carboxymuconolactone decarboxylase